MEAFQMVAPTGYTGYPVIGNLVSPIARTFCRRVRKVASSPQLGVVFAVFQEAQGCSLDLWAQYTYHAVDGPLRAETVHQQESWRSKRLKGFGKGHTSLASDNIEYIVSCSIVVFSPLKVFTKDRSGLLRTI